MRKSSFVIIAFAASVALVACDDSSSASDDEVPESSEFVPKSSGAVPGSSASMPESSAIPESSVTPVSSAIPESSNNDALSAYYELFKSSSSFEPDSASCDSVISSAYPYECSDSLQIDGVYYSMSGYFRSVGRGCTYRCQDNKWSYVSAIPDGAEHFSDMDMGPPSEEIKKFLFKKCNAGNEGVVDSLSTGSGNPKGGTGRDFYRCEQGNWVKSPAWVACDTTGVTVGDVCQKNVYSRGIQFGDDTWLCYKYTDEGTWESTDCPEEGE